MTSAEIIKKTIDFAGPERIGYELPEPFGSDIFIVTQDYDMPADLENGYRRDMWGAIWRTVDNGMGEVVKPPLEKLEDYDSYIWPDICNTKYWTKMTKQVQQGRKDGKYILAGLIVRLYEQMHFLRGIDNLMMDFYEDRPRLERMADDCVNIICGVLDRHAENGGTDGMMTMDDWGLQDRLMINPALWREFFKPRYKKIWSHAHKLGMQTFLHSCGKITDILEDMIEAGLNVIQMDQQMNMGLDELAKKFGGRITFWCPVDIQAVMPSASQDQVRHYAREMMHKLGNFNGGFIGKWYPASHAVGHSWENIQAMGDVFSKEGKYPFKKGTTCVK